MRILKSLIDTRENAQFGASNGKHREGFGRLEFPSTEKVITCEEIRLASGTSVLAIKM